jgi:hypothetical protein
MFGGGRNEDIHKSRIRVPFYGCGCNLFAQSISGLKEKDIYGWGMIRLVASSLLFGVKTDPIQQRKAGI